LYFLIDLVSTEKSMGQGELDEGREMANYFLGPMPSSYSRRVSKAYTCDEFDRSSG